MNTNYSYVNAPAHPGMIADQAPRYVVARILDEDAQFGIAAIFGATPGKTIKKPATGATGAKVEGVILNHGTTEHQHPSGEVALKKGTTCSVMTYGTVWVRVETDIETAYGDACKVLISGNEAGYFTTAETEGTAVDISGIFLGAAENGIAKVKLFDAAAPTPVTNADKGAG